MLARQGTQSVQAVLDLFLFAGVEFDLTACRFDGGGGFVQFVFRAGERVDNRVILAVCQARQIFQLTLRRSQSPIDFFAAQSLSDGVQSFRQLFAVHHQSTAVGKLFFLAFARGERGQFFGGMADEVFLGLRFGESVLRGLQLGGFRLPRVKSGSAGGGQTVQPSVSVQYAAVRRQIQQSVRCELSVNFDQKIADLAQ